MLVPTSTSLEWSLTESSPSKTMCVGLELYPVYLRELIFWVWWNNICGHLCVTSLLFYIWSPNHWVLFSGVGVSCWMSLSASWGAVVFSGQALRTRCIQWPGFVPISFLSLCHRHCVAGHRVTSNCNHCLFNKFPSASNRVRHPELRPQLIHWGL